MGTSVFRDQFRRISNGIWVNYDCARMITTQTTQTANYFWKARKEWPTTPSFFEFKERFAAHWAERAARVEFSIKCGGWIERSPHLSPAWRKKRRHEEVKSTKSQKNDCFCCPTDQPITCRDSRDDDVRKIGRYWHDTDRDHLVKYTNLSIKIYGCAWQTLLLFGESAEELGISNDQKRSLREKFAAFVQILVGDERIHQTSVVQSFWQRSRVFFCDQ